MDSQIRPQEIAITLKEACRRLNVGRTTMNELCRSGAIRTVPIGRRGLRVPVSSLEAFVREGATR